PAERAADPEPARLGYHRREGQVRRALRPGQPRVVADLGGRAADRYPDDRTVPLGHERRVRRVAQQLGPLVARILPRRWLQRGGLACGDDRSPRVVLGDDLLQRGERPEIRQPRLPERETVAGQGFYRSRPDSVHLLLAEPEAVPRVERVRRYDRVVRGTPLV